MFKWLKRRQFHDTGHGVGSPFSRKRQQGIGSKFNADRCDGVGSPKYDAGCDGVDEA